MQKPGKFSSGLWFLYLEHSNGNKHLKKFLKNKTSDPATAIKKLQQKPRSCFYSHQMAPHGTECLSLHLQLPHTTQSKIKCPTNLNQEKIIMFQKSFSDYQAPFLLQVFQPELLWVKLHQPSTFHQKDLKISPGGSPPRKKT